MNRWIMLSGMLYMLYGIFASSAVASGVFFTSILSGYNLLWALIFTGVETGIFAMTYILLLFFTLKHSQTIEKGGKK